MPRLYRNYTDEDFTNAVRGSKSIAGTLQKLGLKSVGGNYYTAKKNLQRLNLDTSHWTGQGWSKGEQLKDWKEYKKPRAFRKHLLKLRGYTCEECNGKEWLGKPIPLEVDHVDGNRANNDFANLRVLCPNCHALTPTWRGRKKDVLH